MAGGGRGGILATILLHVYFACRVGIKFAALRGAPARSAENETRWPIIVVNWLSIMSLAS